MLLYYQEEVSYTNNVGEDIKKGIPKRHMALSGRLTYGYQDRYLIEGNFGYTGSENFQKDHRFGWFPALSLGWVVSEEPFIKKHWASWMDMYQKQTDR